MLSFLLALYNLYHKEGNFYSHAGDGGADWGVAGRKVSENIFVIFMRIDILSVANLRLDKETISIKIIVYGIVGN